MRLEEREVGADRALEDVAASVEDALLLALGDRRADAGRREEPGEPGAAGAHALDQRPLRHHLELDLAGLHLLADRRLERRVGHVAADELPDLLLVGEDVERGRPARPACCR